MLLSLDQEYVYASMYGTDLPLNLFLLGMSDDEVARKEMSTLLCMSDHTYSQIMDLIPEKCGIPGQAKNINTILHQVEHNEKSITLDGLQL